VTSQTVTPQSSALATCEALLHQIEGKASTIQQLGSLGFDALGANDEPDVSAASTCALATNDVALLVMRLAHDALVALYKARAPVNG